MNESELVELPLRRLRCSEEVVGINEDIEIAANGKKTFLLGKEMPDIDTKSIWCLIV